MTNREKAIADFTKYLDTLNAEELADIINGGCATPRGMCMVHRR